MKFTLDRLIRWTGAFLIVLSLVVQNARVCWRLAELEEENKVLSARIDVAWQKGFEMKIALEARHDDQWWQIMQLQNAVESKANPPFWIRHSRDGKPWAYKVDN